MTPQQFLDSGAFFSPKIYESEVEKGDLVWCRKLACLVDSSKLSDNVLNFLKLKKPSVHVVDSGDESELSLSESETEEWSDPRKAYVIKQSNVRFIVIGTPKTSKGKKGNNHKRLNHFFARPNVLTNTWWIGDWFSREKGTSFPFFFSYSQTHSTHNTLTHTRAQKYRGRRSGNTLTSKRPLSTWTTMDESTTTRTRRQRRSRRP